jgi:TPR repeat protein
MTKQKSAGATIFRRKAITFTVLALLSCLVLYQASGLAAALCYDRALDEYDSRNYVAASYWLVVPAYAGRPDAMTLLGSMYATGKLGPIDGETSETWLLKAASKDYVDAQSLLGIMYATGVGLRRDRIKATYWLGMAAAKGDAPAIRVLGTISQQSGVLTD